MFNAGITFDPGVGVRVVVGSHEVDLAEFCVLALIVLSTDSAPLILPTNFRTINPPTFLLMTRLLSLSAACLPIEGNF